MSHLEEKLIARFSAVSFLVFGAAVALVGILPLWLYTMFGPPDGNPIGLGLLALAAVAVGAMSVFIGVLKLLVQFFMSR